MDIFLLSFMGNVIFRMREQSIAGHLFKEEACEGGYYTTGNTHTAWYNQCKYYNGVSPRNESTTQYTHYMHTHTHRYTTVTVNIMHVLQWNPAAVQEMEYCSVNSQKQRHRLLVPTQRLHRLDQRAVTQGEEPPAHSAGPPHTVTELSLTPYLHHYLTILHTQLLQIIYCSASLRVSCNNNY